MEICCVQSIKDKRKGREGLFSNLSSPSLSKKKKKAGTPYEKGSFRLRLSLPSDFPASPPTARFSTKIFHPNVSTAGDVCVNVLKKDWKPDLGLRHVLMVIRCLLVEPFPNRR